MKIQNLSTINRFYSPQMQLHRSAASKPISNTQNQVSFGKGIRINIDDATKFYTELFGVKVEKICDIGREIKFESVSNFPVLKALDICKNARKNFEDLYSKLKEDEMTVPMFAKKLYEYTQMGGEDFRCAPAGLASYENSLSRLSGATPNKVIVPIVVSNINNVHSGYASEVRVSNYSINRAFKNSLRTEKVITEFEGQKYELIRKGELNSSLYSVAKYNQ